MKNNTAINLILCLCLTEATTSLGAVVDGDIELLRLVAETQKNNRERIQTWSGTTQFEHRIQNGVFRPDAANDYEHSASLSFVEDRVRNAVRFNSIDKVLFNRDTEKAIASGDIADPKSQAPRPAFRNAMVKADGYYSLSGAGPIEQARQKQIVIFPRDKVGPDWRASGPFSPIKFLQEIHFGQDNANHLVSLYDAIKDGQNEKRGKEAESKGVHTQVIRDKNFVVFATRFEGVGSETIKYDLSTGGNIVEVDNKSSIADIHLVVTYEEHDGIWIPRSYEETRKNKPNSSSMRPTANTEVKKYVFDNAVINQPVDEAEFTLEKMGATQGTLITDRRNASVPIIYKYEVGAGSLPDQGLIRVMTSRKSPGSTSTAPATQPIIEQQPTSSPSEAVESVRVEVPDAGGWRVGVYVGIVVLVIVALVIVWTLRSKQQSR